MFNTDAAIVGLFIHDWLNPRMRNMWIRRATSIVYIGFRTTHGFRHLLEVLEVSSLDKRELLYASSLVFDNLVNKYQKVRFSLAG